MTQPIHILLVEDDETHAELIWRAFVDHTTPMNVVVTQTLAETHAYLSQASSLPSLIVSDWKLPDGEALELLATYPHVATVPIVIMTSQGDQRIAVEALKAGALDYIVKSEETLQNMPHIVERALREWRHIAERKYAEVAMQRYIARLEILHEIDQAILMAQSPEEIAAGTLKRIIQIIPCWRASVAVFDMELGQARILAVNQEGNIQVGITTQVPLVAFGDLTRLQRGLPFYMADAAEDMENNRPFSNRTRADGITSFLVTPLLSRNELIGCLNLEARIPHAFEADHQQIAYEVATQLAIALQQNRLFTETSELLTREQLLNEVTRTINSTLNLEQLLPTVVRLAAELVGAEAGGIDLISPDGHSLLMPYSFNYPAQLLPQPPLPPEISVAWQVIQNGRAILLDEYKNHPHAMPEMVAAGIHAFLDVPVMAGNIIVGALGVFCYTPEKRFSQRDAALVESIGQQAGLAIQKARLFETEQRRVELLTALHKFGLDISAQLELPTLLNAIVENAIRLLKAYAGGLYLWRADEQELELVVSINPIRDLSGMRLKKGEGLAGRVAQTGEPTIISDYLTWPHRVKAIDDVQIRGMVQTPIKWQDEVVGIITVEGNRPGCFGPADLEIVNLLAAQAAVAVQNARLFDFTTRQLEELTFLHATATAAAEAINEDTLIERITQIIGQQFGGDAFGLVFIEPETGLFRVHPSYQGISEEAKQPLVPLGYGVCGTVALIGKSYLVPDVRSDPIYVCLRPETLSELCVPLRLAERVIGVINMESNYLGAFNAADERLLSTCAGQLAGALERLRAEAKEARLAEQVREAEKKYRSIFENSMEGVFQVAENGRILSANPALARILGYDSSAEIIEQVNMIAPDLYVDPAQHQEILLMLQEQAEIRDYRFQIWGKNGRKAWVSKNAHSVYNTQGQFLYYEGTLQDITERTQLEEQLRQAQKMEAIGRLAGGIAHDFNNILTVIISYSDILLHLHQDEQNPIHKRVKQIRNAGEKATRLIKQLLTFSRQQMLEPRILNLNTVINNSLDMLRRLIGEDIDMKIALADNLGDIKADPGQLEQVVWNLVVNARDAMPLGGKLTLKTENCELDANDTRHYVDVSPGPYVLFTIGDTGQGMDAVTRAHIFEPFFTTKEKGKGTGLGLATVHGIVKQSGGHIEVESELGQGTLFKVYLPRVNAHQVANGSKQVLGARVGGAETILLAEDEEIVRDLAREVLALQGYNVLEARSGEDALHLSANYPHPIHLLLTDVIMPGISGGELAERLIPTRPTIKVLYMSGYTDNVIVHHGVLQPGVAFLQKPFTPDVLAAKVRDVLDTTMP